MSNIFIIQGQTELAAGIRYEVDCSAPPIGEGGMGRVYSGLKINERTGVRLPVAVKFLYGDLPQSMIERVKREASIQIHNDNLVEMHGMVTVEATDSAGQPVKRLHVVSELLQGVMLHDLLQGVTTDVYGQEVPFAQQMYKLYQEDRTMFAVKIVKNILSGIMALHDHGFIHRDIDPSNIMLTVDNKVKLIDFGIARKFGSLIEDRPLTTTGTFIGKAEYAAPELVLGDINHQNETTDIYAVGIVLFQLATGHKPFTGPTNEVLQKQQYERLPLDEISNPTLCAIIDKATDKIQSRRYQSAAEFRVDVDRMEREYKQTQHCVAAPVDPYSSVHNRRGGADSAYYQQSAEISNAGTQVIDESTEKKVQDVKTDRNHQKKEDKKNRKQKSKQQQPNSSTIIAENTVSSKHASTEAEHSGDLAKNGGGTVIVESSDSISSSTEPVIATVPEALGASQWQKFMPWAAAAIGGLVLGAIAGVIF